MKKGSRTSKSVKLILATALLTTVACKRTTNNPPPKHTYDDIIVVLGSSAIEHATRIKLDFEAVLPSYLDRVAITYVFDDSWTEFSKELKMLNNSMTIYVGDTTYDQSHGASSLCNSSSCTKHGFTGLWSRTLRAAFAGINYRGSLERLPTLMAHEMGHGCGLGHEQGTFMARVATTPAQQEVLENCFY